MSDRWETRKIRVGREYLEENLRHGRGEHGAEVDLQGSGEPWMFQFTTPEFASREPLLVHAWDLETERCLPIDIRDICSFGSFATPLTRTSGLG